MGDYLVVSGAVASEPSLALKEDARIAGMTISNLASNTWLAVSGPHAPKTLGVGVWTLIGDAFNRNSPILPDVPQDPLSYERKLIARFWGRYIGIRLSGAGEITAVLRDPSGARECVTWIQDGLTLVTSHSPDWLLRRLSPCWRIDFEGLARSLRDPLMSAGALPLDGPVSVPPGAFQAFPLEAPAEPLWAPGQFVPRRGDSSLDSKTALIRLRSAVDEAVSGLARLPAAMASEISGGLDSGIVASSLVHQQSGNVRLWLNAHGDTPESDERPFVAALADRLGISPVSVPLASAPVTEEGLMRISGDWRPGINGLDVHHDLDWAQRVKDAGATAIMTGKGGDSIFLQGATTDVFTDLWRSRGLRSLLHPDVLNLAALNEISIWSMVGEARRYHREGNRPPLRDDGLLKPLAGGRPPHPWLAAGDDIGPAKRLQIAGVIDNISRHAPSLQTETIDVLNPLCAQPVIEACLSIPAPMMTLGGRDRGLARHAFRDRLPELIVKRRSKGNLTRIYGRMILDSLDVLRPWLLDGRLAATGILDRASAEILLTRESLMWRGHYGEIMVAAAFEGWVRTWEARLARPA